MKLLLSLLLFFALPQGGVAKGGQSCEGLFVSAQIAQRDYEEEGYSQEQIEAHQYAIDLIPVFEKIEQDIQRELGPRANAFARVGRYQSYDAIYNGLLFTEVDGQTVENHAGYAKNLYHSINTDLYKKGVEFVYEQSAQVHRSLFEGERSTLKQYQATMIAVNLIKGYLTRFIIPNPSHIPDEQLEEDNQSESQEQEQEQVQQQEQQQEQQEDQEHDLEDLSDEYEPGTDELSESSSQKQKKTLVAEFAGDTAYFKLRHYEIVDPTTGSHPFRTFTNSLLKAEVPVTSQKTKSVLMLRTKKNHVIVPQIPGYEIISHQEPGVKLERTADGRYFAETPQGKDAVFIYLRKQRSQPLDPMHLDVLSKPVGFATEDWAEGIQKNILSAESKDALKFAKKIEEYIHNNYSYSKDAQPEKTPTSASKSKKFQCDMAAYIMISLLREKGIPCRMAAGYRRTKYNRSLNKTYLALDGNTSKHAWVEVYFNGKWYSFDPTPPGEENNQGGEGEESDEDASSEESNQDRDNSASDGSGSNLEEQSQEMQEEAGKEATAESQEETRDSKEIAEEVEEKSQEKSKEIQKKDSEEQKNQEKNQAGEYDFLQGLSEEEIKNLLELKDINLDKKISIKDLAYLATQTILREALRPDVKTEESLKKLGKIQKFIKNNGGSKFKDIMARAFDLFRNRKNKFTDEAESISYYLTRRKLTDTFDDILKLRRRMEHYSEVQRDDRVRSKVLKFVAALKEFQNKLNEYAHPDGNDIAIVDSFYRDLPPISRQVLKERTDLSTIGPNAATRETAKQLREGDLQDLNLISKLAPLASFTTDTIPTQAYTEVKTWERNRRYPRGNDFMQVTDPSDIYSGMRMDPLKSHFENYVNGTLYKPIRRRTVEIPDPSGITEPERITVVGYDTSGSMNGEPGAFQAGFISAFVDKALSDVTPSGKHLHRAVLMGFDSSVHTVHPVANTQEARAIIQNYRSNLKNTEGSTKIMSFIEQAFASIIEAQKKARDPLANANIILMTDGDDGAIDLDRLRELRKAVDHRTNVQLFFVAISGENEELHKFALESSSVGINKGFYREFNDEIISEILQKSREVKENQDSYYAEAHGREIPAQLQGEFDKIVSLAHILDGEIQAVHRTDSISRWEGRLSRLPYPENEEIERDIHNQIDRIRGMLISNPWFKESVFSEPIVHNILKYFKDVTGEELSRLSRQEQQALRHFVRDIQ